MAVPTRTWARPGCLTASQVAWLRPRLSDRVPGCRPRRDASPAP